MTLTNKEITIIKLSLMDKMRENAFLIKEDISKENYLKKNEEMEVIINKLDMMAILNID